MLRFRFYVLLLDLLLQEESSMVTVVAKTYLRMLPLSLFSGARSETENQVHLGCSMTFGSPSNLIYCITTSTDTYTDAHGLLRQQSKG